MYLNASYRGQLTCQPYNRSKEAERVKFGKETVAGVRAR